MSVETRDEDLSRLTRLVARLRAPDGCPWDREQTRESVRAYVIEEAHEVAAAIDTGSWNELAGELGDLLFQIVFLSRLAKEEGAFTAGDVVRGIAEKMIRRHPHVFGDDEAETSEDVLRTWEEIKRRIPGSSATRRPRRRASRSRCSSRTAARAARWRRRSRDGCSPRPCPSSTDGADRSLTIGAGASAGSSAMH